MVCLRISLTMKIALPFLNSRDSVIMGLICVGGRAYSHLHLAARARPEHMSPLGIEVIGPQIIEAIEL